MRHNILKENIVSSNVKQVAIKLIGENEYEINAIQKVETFQASEDEKDLVENYLLFQLGLGNYSVVEIVSQQGNLFFIKININ